MPSVEPSSIIIHSKLFSAWASRLAYTRSSVCARLKVAVQIENFIVKTHQNYSKFSDGRIAYQIGRGQIWVGRPLRKRDASVRIKSIEFPEFKRSVHSFL